MGDWNEIYVTDKTGQKFFRTTASPMSTLSEIRNIKRVYQNCSAIDQASAVLMFNGKPYGESDISDDDLLAELGN